MLNPSELTVKLNTRLSTLALACAALMGSGMAAASDYYIVTPVRGKTVSASAITVALSAYALPEAVAGVPYAGFDFKSVLQVTGDATYSGTGVSWSVASGALPAGMTLNADGTLSGTPTASGTASFSVKATYKTKTGEQAYQVVALNIVVGLSGTSLPAGLVGSAYSYDLTSRLSITGDPSYSGSGVAWSIPSGSLPSGVSFSGGKLTGNPSVAGTSNFTAKATYRGKSAQADYSVVVNPASVGIVLQAGGYRTWADGTYAASCNDYLNPSEPKAYTGSTGDGVYRIQPSGQAATDVKCDMTNDGGGWTLVVGISAANRNHVTTGASTWTALTLAAPKGKYTDAFINAVNAAAAGAIGYRLTSGTMTSYFPATCTFAATTTATSNCGTYTQTYSASPTWVTGATSSDGCAPPTYYTGLSSMKHAACNGGSVPADNGGLVYGRLGNNNTTGMTTDKNGNYVVSADGELWVR